MEAKRCSHCGESLPLADFARDSSKSSGLRSHCRKCVSMLRHAEQGQVKRAQQLSAAELNDLAYTTRNWAMQRRAALDVATGAHGYFTFDEWCESFNLPPKVWKQVKQRMFWLGLALSYDEFGGYYIGKAGDQMKPVLARLKRVATEAATIGANLTAQQQSKDWPLIGQRLSLAIAGTPLLDSRGICKALTSLGVSLPANFERMLTESALQPTLGDLAQTS